MAINLLPTEHKNKFKKQKSASTTQNYQMEMTGVEKFDSNRSGIKKAGVLSFFKQNIAKPKEEKKEIVEDRVTKPFDDKRVRLKQKITYKNVIGNRPKIEYHVPARKPESLKQKVDQSSRFSFFSKKYKPEQKSQIDSSHLYLDDKKQFPKYQPISAEKVMDPEHLRIKKTKIVEVTSGGNKDAKKVSGWQRFKNWLSGLFSRSNKKSEDFQDPDKISKLGGFPKPQDKPIQVINEKNIIDPQKTNFEYIDKKIGKPAEPQKKEQLISYATPTEVEEEITTTIEQDKKPDRPVYQPKEIRYDNLPPRQEKIVASNFLNQKTNIKIDKLIKEEKSKQIPVKKDGMWKKFINWLSGLFKFQKKDKKSELKELPAPELLTETKDDLVEIKKEINIPIPKPPQAEHKIISFPTNEVFNIKSPQSISLPTPPGPVVPPPPAKEEPKLDQFPKEKIVTGKKEEMVEVPPPPSKKEGSPAGPAEKLSQPISINSDQINWEVNLIPEEAQEKEIPISKILVLIMSLIISVGIIFGGWLWANYYYNTISVTISEVDTEIANIQSEVAMYESIQDEAKQLQQKIENVNLLLEKHIYWAEFFNKLEFYTVPNVYYNNLTADVNGTITLTAVSDTYENAIKQLYVFKAANDFVTTVTISSISKDAPLITINENTNIATQPLTDVQKVNFSISLTINPLLFYYIN